MKLISFQNSELSKRLGLFIDGSVIDLKIGAEALSLKFPSCMNEFLAGGRAAMETARKVHDAFTGCTLADIAVVKNATPLAPVPDPPSCRDAYAFRQHVATARRNRGVPMIKEFDQYPVFYFTNHNSIIGEGELIVESDHLQRLDFELEGAIVIGKGGRNIRAKDADKHVAGLTIMNDFSARTLQMEEMKLNLGPAKGKDFATAIGPWLVTLDELESKKISSEFGDAYDLGMTAKHNGQLISSGNLKDMNWTFAEIIERASYGVDLYPGDVIGSGTVGTGCYLELNGTNNLKAKEAGKSFTPVWLAEGDSIDLEIDCLGILRHTIVKSKQDYSILSLKKITAEASAG